MLKLELNYNYVKRDLPIKGSGNKLPYDALIMRRDIYNEYLLMRKDQKSTVVLEKY